MRRKWIKCNRLRSTTANIGDVFSLACIGTTVYVIKNGTVLTSVTDTTFSSGGAALGTENGGITPTGFISNFQIGSAGFTPSDQDYDPSKPFLGSVRVVGSAPAGARIVYVGTVINIGATPPTGLPNPFLGDVIAGTPSSNDSNPALGQVVEVASAPAGENDPFLGAMEGL